MVETKITGQEIIRFYGKEMYGEKFRLIDPDLTDCYKSVYGRLVDLNQKKAKKGVLVIGNVGVGKTAMMKIMQRAFKRTETAFKSVNSYQLRDMSENLTIGEIKAIYGADLKMDLYIDDIGVFSDVKRYGNTVNIIGEIIMERYDLFIASGYRTHLSSNLMTDIKDNVKNIPTIKSVFGARVLDRIKEMNDIFIFKGSSKRK